MKVDYTSDLHIDHFVQYNSSSPSKRQRQIKRYVNNILPSTPSSTLIIAGDISHCNTMSVELIKEFKNTYDNILLTFGNHDLYMLSESQRNKYQASHLRVANLKESCEEIDGVWLLDGDKVEIDGIIYGGLPGWYSLPTKGNIGYWNTIMNDSRYIYSGVEYKTMYTHGRVRAEWDTQGFYQQQKAMLEGLRGIDVLVTHICQVLSPDSVVAPQYRGDPSNIFYYVDNFELVKATGCKYYIYGHIHDAQEWEQDDIKFRANPYGYPSESVGRQVKTMEIRVNNDKTTI